MQQTQRKIPAANGFGIARREQMRPGPETLAVQSSAGTRAARAADLLGKKRA